MEQQADSTGSSDGTVSSEVRGDVALALPLVAPDTLRKALQRKCSDWGTYWRAPDSHGVELSQEQALELLQDALGVEVEIAAPGSDSKHGAPEAWTPVSEQSPGPGVTVLFGYRNSYGKWRTLRGHYSPLHTVDASAWEDGSDDTEDGSFEPEGWWEEPVESETLNFVSDEVTHWMPLPAPPAPADNEVQKPNQQSVTSAGESA